MGKMGAENMDTRVFTNEELVGAWQDSQDAGNREYLLSVIISRVTGLMKETALNFGNLRDCDFDDRVRLMEQSLLELLPRFDAGKGKLTTVCTWHFRQVLGKEYRKQMAQSRGAGECAASLDELAENEEGESMSGGRPYIEYGYDLVETKEMLRMCLLTETETLVCNMLVDGFTKKDIKEALGVSDTRVTQHVNKIKEKLRRNGVVKF